MKTCISCKVEVSGVFTEFKCPSCNKEKIVRCQKCKKSGKPYKCSACNFEGP